MVLTINHALSLLRRFGFIEEREEWKDIILSVHDSYQQAIVAGLLEQEKGEPSGTAKLQRNDSMKSILKGLVGWVRLREEIHEKILLEKRVHAWCFYDHLKKMDGDNEELIRDLVTRLG